MSERLWCEAIARAALGPPGKKARAELLWRCPRHDDKHPSLSVNPQKNAWLCGPCGKSGNAWELAAFLAGVDANDRAGVRQWLADHGLFSKGLSGNGKAAKIVAAYSYLDEAGRLLFEVVRYEPKAFRQRRPDGSGGWLWDLYGVRRVLYNLPEVLKAASVLIVEGERDCETGRKLRLTATCNSGGAGKWRPEYSVFLRGKRVCVICDADAPGLAHGHDVARSLVGVTASVKLIEALPGEGVKDLTDYFHSGGTRESLLNLIRDAPELTAADVAKWGQPKPGTGFTLTPLSELLAKPDAPVDYVVENILVVGTLSAMVSKPKVGKSTFARNLCLAVSRGNDFLGLQTKQGECIYLGLEEREEDVRNDFRAMGADGGEPILIHAAAAPAEGIRALCELVKERKPRLVVIDPLFRLARVQNESAYAEIYAALGPLIDVSREIGTHVMVLHHSGKGAGKPDPIDSPLGSTAIGGAVSTLIVLKRTESYRTIQTVQRVAQAMPETVLNFDPETRRLSIGGTRFEADRKACEAAILEFLEGAAGPQTQAQIRDGVEGRVTVIRAALTALAEAGRIQKTGDGTKGKPFFYEFPNSGSHYMPGTRKPESEKVAQTRVNIGPILVPEDSRKAILVPEDKTHRKPAIPSPPPRANLGFPAEPKSDGGQGPEDSEAVRI
jgi:hypothetical protein